jgi:hypothetical protein
VGQAGARASKAARAGEPATPVGKPVAPAVKAATDIPNRPSGGDRGIFQSAQRGTKRATGSLMAGQNFIIADAAGPGNNFTGSLTDTFECIASLGDTGCGFEHPFASVLCALGADGQAPPTQNATFLRPNAPLFVLLFTNEDGCSAPADSSLFDPASKFMSDQWGPLQSYRCNASPRRAPAASATAPPARGRAASPSNA